NGKFATVAKSKLEFKYKLGDKITIENDDGKLYFVPYDKDDEEEQARRKKEELRKDFWGDDEEDIAPKPGKKAKTEEKSSKPLTGLLISLGLAIVGWFIAFYACLGGAIAAIIWSLNRKKDEEDTAAFNVLLALNVIVWAVELMYATGVMKL
ncbi:hypothetical protein IKG20_00970, partial [Candidatus Saccharibacteria bacterium]|nr:hypothetical protein [Candidatus Saccharibacteria bacterium]